MKKILNILVIFVVLLASQSNQVFAGAPDCTTMGVDSISIAPKSFTEEDNITSVNIKIGSSHILNEKYLVKVFDDKKSGFAEDVTSWVTNSGSTMSFQLTSQKALTGDDLGPSSVDRHHVYLFSESNGQNDRWCYLGSYDVKKAGYVCTSPIIIAQARPDEDGETQICYYNGEDSCLDVQSPIQFEVSGVLHQGEPSESAYALHGQGKYIPVDKYTGEVTGSPAGHFSWSRTMAENSYYVWLMDPSRSFSYTNYGCDGTQFTVVNSCPPEECETEREAITLGPDTFSLCTQIPEEQEAQRLKCIECAGGVNGRAGIWTAVGCIGRDPQVIIEKLVTVGLGIGGGFALITFLTAGFIYSTSQGSSEKVKNAKEMMTASIIGIIFVIFSVTILQFIGWSILKIPGFGG